jgi:glyoxylase-like metal-dependent hydrolase (beta-lactamase superfamily II)
MNGFKELYTNTWYFDDGGVRIFLVAGEEKALVIDTGMTGIDIHKAAKAVTDLPLMLLNTHSDPDHTGGNSKFSEFMKHPSEMVIYHNLFHQKGRVLPVFEGDAIDLGGRELEVVHVPGHTPGSITLLDKNERCLLGGDPIQIDGDIYMFGLHRDMEAYVFGLEHLLKRVAQFDWIYPSHQSICHPLLSIITGYKTDWSH